MANHRQQNVIFVDTTADFADQQEIEAIKYVGNTSGTAIVKEQNTSGVALWQEAGTANVFNQVCIRSPKGIRVEVTNGAKVYIYLK